MRPALMNDIDFASYLVSRVCHDLVGPMGAVVNGLEVLEDESDAQMRADALRIVTQSAEQALAKLQFVRIAFGAAGSHGAELDLAETGRLIDGLLSATKVRLDWRVPQATWPKDWAKLLMNGVMLAADSLPRGGHVEVGTSDAGALPCFRIHARGPAVKLMEQVKDTALGDGTPDQVDARTIQPLLLHRLAATLGTDLVIKQDTEGLDIVAG
jgi:histidine phosphotransferase ChpT